MRRKENVEKGLNKGGSVREQKWEEEEKEKRKEEI